MDMEIDKVGSSAIKSKTLERNAETSYLSLEIEKESVLKLKK